MKFSARTLKPARRWLTAFIAAVAILASACGSSNDTSAAPELASIDEPAAASATEDEPATTEAADATEDDAAVDDATAADATKASEPPDPDRAFAEFEACMADFGVTVSIGGPGGAPVDELDPTSNQIEPVTPEGIEAAQAACEPILDDAFGSFDLSPEQEAEQSDELLNMQQCLATAGFDIDVTGGRFQVPQDVDFDVFNAALNDCAGEGAFGTGS